MPGKRVGLNTFSVSSSVCLFLHLFSSLCLRAAPLFVCSPSFVRLQSGSNPAVGGRRKSGAGGRSGSSAAARRDAEILAQLHQQDPVQEVCVFAVSSFSSDQVSVFVVLRWEMTVVPQKHDKIMQQREARKSRMEQERLKKLKNANEVYASVLNTYIGFW